MPSPQRPRPSRRLQHLTRWITPALLLVVWLVLGGLLGPYAGKLSDVATNDQSSFLPRSAESTRAMDAQKSFQEADTTTAVVVWTVREGKVDRQQREAATRALASLTGGKGIVGRPSPAVTADDRLALQGAVQLRGDLGHALPGVLDDVRDAASRVEGTKAQIAGPAATQADLSDAFSGIDGILLVVALVVVLLILLLVYRSVLLPLIVILGAVFALSLACAVVYELAKEDVVRVDGQVQGILSILVIGAATDYALLLSARFREELAVHGDRFGAMRSALRRSSGAITASAATVALGVIALLLSDLTNNRALGPVGAIGIVCAVISTLTFLPAALVLVGRAAYWPARPEPDGPATGERDPARDGAAEDGDADEEDAGSEPPEGKSPDGDRAATAAPMNSLWARVADRVDRTPRRVWATTLVALTACAAFSPQLDSSGVPTDEIFVDDVPSVAAQRTLGEHFPGGSGNPAVIVADAGRTRAVVRAAEQTEGVASAAPVTRSGRPGQGEPLVADGRVLIDATLKGGASSDEAKETVERLRSRVHGVPGADALVGGYTAQQHDIQTTAEDDRALIVPVVLLIILAILAVLLRALFVPVLLVATVALNYLATLGISALVFPHVFGFTGTDASVPLYGFVFLVALGVDYNIFLLTRVREEALTHGTRAGIRRGLTTTGGVITSAGVVLAATFAALAVIPLSFLVQIAFIVAFGVLLDTLVVRSLLVPALARDIGPAVWWPGALRRRG
ncbi:MMPL family transporter [Streptomyces marispadix]|uniref:MMPL family transporter n=1 Tax=Streptomyces marispadix TaxID=2922868 RepID=A0ABS9SYS5_9ACTN|nr:MMPL family transporter [Streptomyces marispadix]MCH6161407.1 MMPL family transporter [Streptomyces marispadix]